MVKFYFSKCAPTYWSSLFLSARSIYLKGVLFIIYQRLAFTLFFIKIRIMIKSHMILGLLFYIHKMKVNCSQSVGHPIHTITVVLSVSSIKSND